MDDLDDIDVRNAVRTAGSDAPPQFRSAMRDSLDAALRGELPVAAPISASAPSRGRWLAAAAAVIAVGVVAAAALMLTDDGRGTLTPVTRPPTSPVTTPPSTGGPTSVAPTTALPTTEVPTGPTAPLPDPSIPLLSVDSQFPSASIRTVIESSQSPSTPAPPLHAAVFQGDGWTVWAQAQTDGPVAVAHFTLDGGQAWKVTVPSTVDGRRQTGSIELGPNDVLYVYYAAADSAQVTAVATGGPRAGQTVGAWLVPSTCYETYCGPPMDVNGLVVSDTGTTPYVDANGAPTTATFPQPERASSADEPGPAMPADWVTSDELGGVSLISQRSTVTLGSTSWRFDAVGVMMAGDYYFLRQFVLGDGGLLVWLTTSDGAGTQATRRTQFLGHLLPDGTSSFVEIPIDVIDVIGKDGRIYVTTYDAATGTYTLAELVTG